MFDEPYRGPLTKPYKGEFKDERLDRSAVKRTDDAYAKRDAKIRDGHQCRWPHVCRKGHALHGAHVVDKSLGGENVRSNIVTVCSAIHQGALSLHTKDKKFDALTSEGSDGPLAFYELDRETDTWIHIASERAIGVMETRR